MDAYYDDAAGQKITAEISIANEMQQALDEMQFAVYFQPKYNLSTEYPCGAEALVRWEHPTKGLILPGQFISVFEKNGFITKLDYYVWEQTCCMLRDWTYAGFEPYPVSVNLSRISWCHPQLVDIMTSLIRSYDILPSLLELEITESTYMSNPKMMEKTIEALQKAGFTILMDDFRSDHSSLATLERIKIDALKIDTKFLSLDGEAGHSKIILNSIIEMAKRLAVKVVIEGVETKGQLDFVKEIGVDCAQGFYFAKPMPLNEYEQNYV
ncbi:MAG: EAL domain-containing protein, partial [Clostridia bacterium]|nr:EAL domain-containing protein [Clostridia bacterium]